MPTRIDLTGKQINDWTVVRYHSTGVNKHGRATQAKWLCRCVCGEERVIFGDNLRRGVSKGCGCRLRVSAHTTHGMSGSPEYYIWLSMRDRCANSRNISFHNYGGRGVKVCDRWDKSFENFYSDMGPRPSPDHSIERVDNDKGYWPENCKWATRREQTRNRRSSRMITYDGRTQCMLDWARELGINRQSMKNRLDKWPIERALTEKPRRPRR